MKSSLITFIENYKDSKLSDSRLLTLWKKEIDKSDFDRNEKECWEWFKKSRVITKVEKQSRKTIIK